jgi:N-acetylglucosaminyldiphosphoundecaprenol N-acetyl-beta-D-mannosaminyltransferase
MNQVPRLIVGGVGVAHATRQQLAQVMVADAALADQGALPRPRFVTSVNGFAIALYHRDRAFRALMDQADIIDADGMPLVMASKLFHRDPLVERVATTDFVHDASALAARHGVRFFFLGARPGVAQQAADTLLAEHPGLQIVGVRNGYYKPEEEPALLEEIKASGAHVLWVGLGSPRQEQFAVRNLAALAGLAWVRTCGGLFDHIAGVHPRAPDWMQRHGLEWLHRLIREPRRLGPRYLVTNPVAAFHLLTKTRRS